MAHRIDHAGAVATPPASGAVGTGGYFSGGNPQAGQPATVVTPDWANSTQEEILTVITAAGMTPDKSSWTQLWEAIQIHIANGTPQLSSTRIFDTGQTFEGSVVDGDAVYWNAGNARWEKALAGDPALRAIAGIADVTNGEVTFAGLLPDNVLTGLTPGTAYYLSDSTAGALVTAPPADKIRVGFAVAANKFSINIDTDTVGGASPSTHPVDEFLIVREQKSAGNSAGTATGQQWNKRQLNTVIINNIPGASTGGLPDITLPVGTYVANFHAPARKTKDHRTRLRNVTDGADLGYGTNGHADETDTDVAPSVGYTHFVLTAQKTISLDHWFEKTQSSDGMGRSHKLDNSGLTGDEVFAQLQIQRIAP